ncbi:MAG: patatin family protein [Psychromonas sp.]
MDEDPISTPVDRIRIAPPEAQIIDRIALVTEGGGQRGVFTAGVLDTFIKKDFNPFSLLIGTSAGSLNIASYICGQYRHAYRIITEVTTERHFFDLYRFMRGNKAMDLDWLIKQTQTNLKLDWAQAYRNCIDKTVLVTASDINKQQAVYFNLMNDDKSLALKASCNIPVINKPIDSDNGSFFDGGLYDPIPVKEAYKRGYKHIVVIRTVPIDLLTDRQWIYRVQGVLGKNRAADMLRLLMEHDKNYKETQAFLKNPPDDVKIYEIHPKKLLKSKVLTSRIEDMNADYHEGIKSGLFFLNNMQHHFNK